MADEERKMIEWIDNASYYDLLETWRFGIAGSPYFMGNIGRYFARMLCKRRDEDPAGAVKASKMLGWEK